MNKDNRMLIVILAVLTVSVLLTGGLVVYLTLTRESEEMAEDAAEPTVTAEPTATTIASGEPRIASVSDIEGEAAIYVMDADGTNRQRVSEPERGFCIRPYWSPDGQHVTYLEGEGDPTTQAPPDARIWVSAVDGSEHIHVSQAVPHILRIEPTWSPDGTRMAFASVAEPAKDSYITSTIHIATIDGSIERSIPLPWMIQFLIWSPTKDEWLLIGDLADAEAGVYVLSSENSEGDEITEVFRGALAADWSPDGEAIVVGDYQSNTILILEQDLEPHPVAQLTMEPVEVAWSPNGTHIAVTAARGHQQGYGNTLYVVTVETGEITTVVENEGLVVWPNWSPDGSRLLFTISPLTRRSSTGLPYADLWVYDVASDELAQLTASQGFDGLGVWSP